MAFKIIITKNAQLDIWEILNWYEEHQIGAGVKFNLDVNEMIKKISKNPYLFHIYKKDFKRAVLKSFPYLIIFSISLDQVIIHTVVFGGRDPKFIEKKIS